MKIELYDSLSLDEAREEAELHRCMARLLVQSVNTYRFDGRYTIDDRYVTKTAYDLAEQMIFAFLLNGYIDVSREPDYLMNLKISVTLDKIKSGNEDTYRYRNYARLDGWKENYHQLRQSVTAQITDPDYVSSDLPRRITFPQAPGSLVAPDHSLKRWPSLA